MCVCVHHSSKTVSRDGTSKLAGKWARCSREHVQTRKKKSTNGIASSVFLQKTFFQCNEIKVTTHRTTNNKHLHLNIDSVFYFVAINLSTYSGDFGARYWVGGFRAALPCVSIGNIDAVKLNTRHRLSIIARKYIVCIGYIESRFGWNEERIILCNQ